MARLFLGGNGFAAQILYNELEPHIDPFDPSNKLVFAVGPLNATLIPYGQRFLAASKSPITQLFFDSSCGGHISAMIKKAGYDAIVIEGKADKPTLVSIEKDRTEFLKGESLWNLKTFETVKMIKELCGKHFEVACIGPGGENQVRYANIMAGMRAFGRGGLGAVMGSKNLKAIAAWGDRQPEVYDTEGLDQFRKEESSKLKEAIQSGVLKNLSTLGTPYLVETLNGTGRFGTRNWKEEVFEGANSIGSGALKDKFVVGKNACFGCPVGCGIVSQLNGNRRLKGPEYESLYSLGSMCGVSNLKAVVESNYICDEYGIDTISAGVTIAFAMECYENGIIDRTVTDGLDVRFGNSDAVLTLCEKIGKQEGFGRILSQGTRRASAIFGKESERFAIHTKGLEYGGHSPRALPAMALSYATGTRGGSHHDGRPFEYVFGADYDLEKKATTQVQVQNSKTVEDSLVICHLYERILGYTVGEFHLKAVNLVTGMNLTLEELNSMGERIFSLERLFNVREGATRSLDIIPERFQKEPIPKGPCEGAVISPYKFETMLNAYYKARGWDSNGKPTETRLQQLNLKH